MCPDGCQYACQQVKLVRHERINLREIFSVRIQFLFHTIIEDNQVLDDSRFLVIEQAQGLCRSVCLVQNSFLDNRVHVRGGQGKPCVKAALDLREVIPFDFSDGIDVLLAGHDHPGFSHTLFAQLFRYCLEIQH